MRSVFELIARHIEPSLKRGLVEKLLARGMSKSKVSLCLGLSPSLVTKYSKRERGLHDFTHIPSVNDELNKLADKIAGTGVCNEEIYVEIGRLAIQILRNKYACGIHYGMDKSINPALCKICPSLFKSI